MSRNHLDLRHARDSYGVMEHSPIAGMLLVARDETGNPSYAGWEGLDGSWCINKTNASEDRYVQGSTGFATAWANRASLGYDYPSITWRDDI